MNTYELIQEHGSHFISVAHISDIKLVHTVGDRAELMINGGGRVLLCCKFDSVKEAEEEYESLRSRIEDE